MKMFYLGYKRDSLKEHIYHSVRTCRINQKIQNSLVNLLADVHHIIFTLIHAVMWHVLSQAKNRPRT